MGKIIKAQRLIGLIIVFVILMTIWGWLDAANIRKLSNDGWVFYYSPSCGYCVTQIAHIGSAKLSWMPTVNCVDDPVKCKEKGIDAFPTWLNEKKGKIHTGAILLDSVSKDDAKLVDVLAQAPDIKVNIKNRDNQLVFA